MIIHPTRTNLLLLRERAASVTNSVGILKARRQALIREFLTVTIPFLRSREEIRATYGRAVREISLALGHEGRHGIESLTAAASRDFGVEITQKSIWGIEYKDISLHETAVRRPNERGYDWRFTSPHVEESFYLFEKILESMIGIAAYESKLKRLGDEILRTTRRIRVLEERLLPDLRFKIRTIFHYIAERDREAYYRLKRFKQKRTERR